jgi:CRP-like cAMP-binding protein
MMVMSKVPAPAELRNQILRRVCQPDWHLIAPHLEPVALGTHKLLDAPDRPIDHLYFPENGLVSVVAVNAEDHRIEVGVIGYEGVTGVPVIMGDSRAQHSTCMQIAGNGHRIAADAFTAALQASQRLHALALKSAQGFMIQTSYTALANGRANLEQRLARWLLMAHDRGTTDEVPLTHEFLAVMLGVRRAGVTVAIRRFEEQRLVTTKRGRLTVTDRVGIQAIAGSFYGAPEAELTRLLGEDPWNARKNDIVHPSEIDAVRMSI